ncbi:MAG: hypothetical protein KF896_03380 [Ignavibacteriae bacterium]|nr:hypothetical protein [Ignavibacteriota bacterium]
MKNIKRIHKVLFFIFLIFLTWIIIKPNKVSIQHELLLDKELQLGEMKYDINKRYQLNPESTYEWADCVLDTLKIKEYENKYSLQILIDRSGCYTFSDELINPVFYRLKKFSICLEIISDEDKFNEFSNYLLQQTNRKYGNYSKIISKVSETIYIWNLNDHYFVIYSNNKPKTYYDQFKRSINLTWTKNIDNYLD